MEEFRRFGIARLQNIFADSRDHQFHDHLQRFQSPQSRLYVHNEISHHSRDVFAKASERNTQLLQRFQHKLELSSSISRDNSIGDQHQQTKLLIVMLTHDIDSPEEKTTRPRQQSEPFSLRSSLIRFSDIFFSPSLLLLKTTTHCFKPTTSAVLRRSSL
jgi:hypothetical protein